MNPNHTPLPWHVSKYNSIYGPNNNLVADICWGDKEANAAFIVRACNSHYQLVEALEPLIHLYSGQITNTGEYYPQLLDAARAALAEAKKGMVK